MLKLAPARGFFAFIYYLLYVIHKKMKQKDLITLAVVIIALAGLLWWGRSNQTNGLPEPGTGKKSALIASETLYNFGTISMADGNVSTVFTVTNATDTDMLLSTVVTSCMCTTAYIEYAGKEKGPFGMPGHGGPVAKANEVIKAGESVGIKVVYDPNAHGPAGVGPVDRYIDLTEANGGMTRLEIKARVTP